MLISSLVQIFPIDYWFIIEKTSYLCTRTISLENRLSQLDEFFHGIWRGSLRRAEYGGVIIRQSSTKRALGGKSSPDIMKAFT